MAKGGGGTTEVRDETPQPQKANGTPLAASGGVDDFLRFSQKKNAHFSILFYRKRACSECRFFSKDNNHKFFKNVVLQFSTQKLMFYHLYKNQTHTLFSFVVIKG